ncbi:MAG: alpha/beta hydrolase [Acidimicrobiales bacterium]
MGTGAHPVRQLPDDDGESAALHDLGGDGPPLLLTHGNGLNAGMWATAVPRLQAAFHCYGLDFRGHGASQQQQEHLDVGRRWFATEVRHAVEAIGGAPVLAAGHSLGAATLLRTEQQFPGTLRAVWAFEPVLIPDTFGADRRPPSQLIEASRRRRLVFGSVEEAVARFRSKPPFADCEEAAVRAYVEVGSVPQADGTIRLTCSGETEARIYESNEQLDFATFAAITCPVVVAAGAEIAMGNDIPPLVAPLVADAIPGSTLLTMPGLTHFAPMEDGAAVAAAITAFLSRFT